MAIISQTTLFSIVERMSPQGMRGGDVCVFVCVGGCKSVWGGNRGSEGSDRLTRWIFYISYIDFVEYVLLEGHIGLVS